MKKWKILKMAIAICGFIQFVVALAQNGGGSGGGY